MIAAVALLPILTVISLLPDLTAGHMLLMPDGDTVSLPRLVWAIAMSAVAGLMYPRETWPVRVVVLAVILSALPAVPLAREVWVWTGGALQLSVLLLIGLRWSRAERPEASFYGVTFAVHGFGSIVLYPACQSRLWDTFIAGSACGQISPMMPYIVALAAVIWFGILSHYWLKRWRY